MKTHYLTVTVNIKVKSNLSIEDIIDQFGSETDYNFSSTDEVEVIETEILEVDVYDDEVEVDNYTLTYDDLDEETLEYILELAQAYKEIQEEENF